MIDWYFTNNTDKYNYLHEATEWCLQQLPLNEKVEGNIEISVTRKCFTEYDADGFVEGEVKKGIADIAIYINPKQKKQEMIKTLFHELVHAKQIINKEFRVLPKTNKLVWKRKVVHPKRFKIYENLPWEKEAYRMEKELYQKYINRTN